MDFNYERPKSLEEALKLRARYRGDVTFMAGGTDVLVDIRNGVLKPKMLMDISSLDELNYIKEEDSQIRIGSGTKIAEIQKAFLIQKHAPLLVKACQKFANPLIKNRATIGGNITCASPAADMAPPLLVLDAEAVLGSTRDKRVLPLHKLFCGVKQTRERDDELLIEVKFNKPHKEKSEFLKLGLRNGTCLAVASLSIMFGIANSVIRKPKIALGSVAPTPLRATKTEEMLNNKEPGLDNIRRAGDTLKREVKPISDIRGSAEYRREISAALLFTAFQNLGYVLDAEKAQ